MDKRQNNSGTKGNKGNKTGFGQLNNLRANMLKYEPVFWEKLGTLMLEGDKWALAEYNKIQVKMIPQENLNTNETKLKIELSDADRIIVNSLIESFKQKLNAE